MYYAIFDDQQTTNTLPLSPELSHHLIKVLRKKHGDDISLINGKGAEWRATIDTPHPRQTIVHIQHKKHHERHQPFISLGVPLLNNAGRFEWMIEKITELGVDQIIPIKTARTEPHNLKQQRIDSILQSALQQSQQFYLPQLLPVHSFTEMVHYVQHQHQHLYIAHCLDINTLPLKQTWKDLAQTHSQSVFYAIGPEGDFTEQEIKAALTQGFIPMSLGTQRLRSETAAMKVISLASELKKPLTTHTQNALPCTSKKLNAQ